MEVTSQKVTIPLIDMRGKSLNDFVSAHENEARSVLMAARNVFGFASRAAAFFLMPLADRCSRRWLERTDSPYLAEIDHCAQVVGMSGAHALNAAYEWACTTGAFATGDDVTLLRVLDWGFPELGSRVVVLRADSPAGEYFNMTWPGFTGSVNGLAPGRFAAAINIAPMRKHGLTMLGDWVRNQQIVRQPGGVPPAHLLRFAFENAKDFAAAKLLLAEAPVCAPVIYTLAGTKPGEGCIIERIEKDAFVRELGDNRSVTTSNHFHTAALVQQRHGWRPRGVDSHGRYAQSCTIIPEQLAAARDFEWLAPPMLNWETRLAIIANAKTGRLLVQGFEGDDRVTEVFQM
jgi:hypothetical protein